MQSDSKVNTHGSSSAFLQGLDKYPCVNTSEHCIGMATMCSSGCQISGHSLYCHMKINTQRHDTRYTPLQWRWTFTAGCGGSLLDSGSYNAISQNNLLHYYPRPVLAFGFCHRLRVCVCLCVCVSLYVNHLLAHTITRDPFKLGLPNLDQRCKRPWLRSLLFRGQLPMTFKVKFNLKVRIYSILSLTTP